MVHEGVGHTLQPCCASIGDSKDMLTASVLYRLAMSVLFGLFVI